MKKFFAILILLTCFDNGSILYGQNLSSTQMLAATNCKDSV